MDDFKTRLIDEQFQLADKLFKLDSFLVSDKFNTIDDTQKALLKIQSAAMRTYNQCLQERIEKLGA